MSDWYCRDCDSPYHRRCRPTRVRWRCPCGAELTIPTDRTVPNHWSPTVGRWCAVSGCVLSPRALASR